MGWGRSYTSYVEHETGNIYVTDSPYENWFKYGRPYHTGSCSNYIYYIISAMVKYNFSTLNLVLGPIFSIKFFRVKFKVILGENVKSFHTYS